MTDRGRVLLVVGILGLAGIGIYLLYRSTKPQEPSARPGPLRYVADNGAAPAAKTVYENCEEITFPEGFDPDTLMPRKIVVHRTATVSS